MTTIKASLRRCVEQLSAKNTDYKFAEQAINQAESLKSLSSDLYTDNIRFIYELIQNADDAEASNITIAILDNKYLIIAHNGKYPLFIYHIFYFNTEVFRKYIFNSLFLE
jgi:DNA-binding MurR/RpiR family transcriptional regulator